MDSIEISSTCLYKSLLRVSSVIVNKPLVPVLEDFLLEINEDVLTVTTSDMSTTMYTSIGLDGRYGNVRMAVPSRILVETLKNLPEQPIELINDPVKNILTIKSSSGKYKIMCDDPGVYPSDVKANVSVANKIVIPGKKLIESIENTIVVASTDPLKPVINSILFEVSNNELVSVATDIHRLIKYSVSLGDCYDSIRFVVPKRALVLLKNILIHEEVQFCITDRYMYLESGNDVFISALIKEEYPDYERVIPRNYKNTLFINRFELLGALRRLAGFTNGINFQIKFKISKNKLTLIAEDINSENDGIEEIECNYNYQDLIISYNIKYLLDILMNIKTDIVLMMFSDPNENMISNSSTIIKPFHDKEPCNYDFIALIMPIFI